MRIFAVFALAFLWSMPSQAASLASIDDYYLDFQSTEKLGECRDELLDEFEDELVEITERRQRAGGIIVVELVVSRRGIRNSLVWTAAVYDQDKELLFHDSAEESGWSLESACIDAVQDVADELGDAIREARIKRGLRRSRIEIIQPEPEPADLPLPTPLPEPEAVSEPAPKVKEYRIEERPIDLEAGTGTQEPNPVGTRKGSQWQGKARALAREHGCSEQFESVQSLPSGAEIYVTICGGYDRTMISCNETGQCEFNF